MRAIKDCSKLKTAAKLLTVLRLNNNIVNWARHKYQKNYTESLTDTSI